MPLTRDSVIVVTEDQVSTSVGGEVVILGMHDGVYYGLDAVGARVWAELQTATSISSLIATIVDEFDVSAEQCEQDVLALVEDLARRGLVHQVSGGEGNRGA